MQLQLTHNQQATNPKELSTLKRHKCRVPTASCRVSNRFVTVRQSVQKLTAEVRRRREGCDLPGNSPPHVGLRRAVTDEVDEIRPRKVSTVGCKQHPRRRHAEPASL